MQHGRACIAKSSGQDGGEIQSIANTWTHYLLSFLPWQKDHYNKAGHAQQHDVIKTASPEVCSGDNEQSRTCTAQDITADLEEPPVMIESSSEMFESMLGVLRLGKKLSRCRTELKLLQYQQSYEMEKVDRSIMFVDDSIQSISRSSSATFAFVEHPDSDVASTISQLQEDWKDLAGRWRSMLGLRDPFSTKQNQIVDIENKLLSALEVLVLKLPRGHAALDQVADDNSALDALSTRSEPVPEIARNHFELLGQVVMLEDEIERLNEDHLEEIRKRDFMRNEQDLEPSLTDDEFESRYRVDNEELESQLAEMRNGLGRLQRQCAQQGIDLHKYGAQPRDGDLIAELQPRFIEDNYADGLIAGRLSQESEGASAVGSSRVAPAIDSWLNHPEFEDTVAGPTTT